MFLKVLFFNVYGIYNKSFIDNCGFKVVGELYILYLSLFGFKFFFDEVNVSMEVICFFG